MQKLLLEFANENYSAEAVYEEAKVIVFGFKTKQRESQSGSEKSEIAIEDKRELMLKKLTGKKSWATP